MYPVGAYHAKKGFELRYGFDYLAFKGKELIMVSNKNGQNPESAFSDISHTGFVNPCKDSSSSLLTL